MPLWFWGCLCGGSYVLFGIALVMFFPCADGRTYSWSGAASDFAFGFFEFSIFWYLDKKTPELILFYRRTTLAVCAVLGALTGAILPVLMTGVHCLDMTAPWPLISYHPISIGSLAGLAVGLMSGRIYLTLLERRLAASAQVAR